MHKITSSLAQKNPKKGIIMSWSGGKDSALALFRVMELYGKRPYTLLTMMIEDGSRSRSHGIRREVLEAQSRALNLPISFFSCSWDSYEKVFENALLTLQESSAGCKFQAAAFGDICLPNDPNWNTHRTWADKICAQAGLHSLQPLWEETEEKLLHDLFQKKFKAMVVCEKVGLPKLEGSRLQGKERDPYNHLTERPQFLGNLLTPALTNELASKGLSPCGERGEFHTFVTDGPLFQYPLYGALDAQTIHQRSGYWHGEVQISGRGCGV